MTTEIGALLEEQKIGLLSFNRDTTPLATRRDARVREAAASHGAELVERRDRVVFEAAEVRTRQGGPFSVFTPYSRRWRECFAEDPRRPQRAPRLPAVLHLVLRRGVEVEKTDVKPGTFEVIGELLQGERTLFVLEGDALAR